MLLLFVNGSAQGNVIVDGEEFPLNRTLNESFSWKNWDGVLKDVDGSSAMDPVQLNFITFIFNCICFTIGFPLNCFMTATILCKKRLLKKGKNIFQLALLLCNFLTLSMTLIKIVYYKWPSEELCLIFVALASLPYTAFFFNLLLLLIDRYVSISHALWHHRKVTARFVLFWLILLNLILVFAVKWPYIGQFVPLRCERRFTPSMNFVIIFFIELVSCFVFHITGFRKANELLQSSRTISVKSNAKGKKKSKQSASANRRGHQRQRQEEEIEMKPMGIDATATSSSADRRITVHRSKKNLSRLKMKTTKTFLIGVIPLLLLPCPLLVYNVFMTFICVPLLGDKKCSSDYGWLIIYFKELISIHVLVYVIISVWRNKDFSWPFRLFRNNTNQQQAQFYG